MKKTIFCLLILCILTSFASAENGMVKPPALSLISDEADGTIDTIEVSSSSFTWNFPDENDEWTAIIACGVAVTDPRIPELLVSHSLDAALEYTMRWDGAQPDTVSVTAWDTAMYLDAEHPENYEHTVSVDSGTVLLEPDSVYLIHAEWSQKDDQRYGKADYTVLTVSEDMIEDAYPVLSGGWSPSESPEITEERAAIFEKGLDGLLGVQYTPVAYLGSQIVAGTNHAFLAQATVVYPGALPSYVVVYLYEDLSGGVSIINIADFDVGALCTY